MRYGTHPSLPLSLSIDYTAGGHSCSISQPLEVFARVELFAIVLEIHF